MSPRLLPLVALALASACTIETRPAQPAYVTTVEHAPAGGEVMVVESAAAPAPTTVPATAADPGPAPAAGGEHPPIDCDGSQDIVLDGVTIRGDVAIRASGSCNVSLTRCTVQGSTAAIVASGSADVALRGCVVSAPVAVQASGASNVVLAGSRVEGEVRSSGAADVVTMQ